jgi:hypothetical protein
LFFLNYLGPCVGGQKFWTIREKANKLISEAKKVVSVLEEALIILAFMKYWKRWNSSGTAIWTYSRAGVTAISTWGGCSLRSI